MPYAVYPPQPTPGPHPPPPAVHAQQPQGGPQAHPPPQPPQPPQPQQRQQHGQGQAGPQGGEVGQMQRLVPSRSPYTHLGPPLPTHQQPHPQIHPTPQPQLRAEVVRILASTANQCITEMNAMGDRHPWPQVETENRELRDHNAKLYEDNAKLVEDNTRLVEVVTAERRKIELMNLNQTQQVWVKTCTDLQTELAKIRNENNTLKNDRHNLVSQINELHARHQKSQTDALMVARSQAERLKSLEQSLKIYHTHCQACPGFRQQVAQNPQRMLGGPSVLGQQPPARAGSAHSLTALGHQQQALMQQHQQQQQRRASAPVLPAGQRALSQPGTPVVGSPAMHPAPPPPGSYFGGRPVYQPQNAASSSSRPSSTQPGQPGVQTPPTSMGPPQHGVVGHQQNQLHVRTPSQQQPYAYTNGVPGTGTPVGVHSGSQGPSSRPNSSTGLLVPVQNMSAQAQAQAQAMAQQQAALNARQHFQNMQQQYDLQLPQSQLAVQSPAVQAQPSASLQQPVPSTPLTPVPNSRPGGSPSPQIFANTFMHSTGNHLGQLNTQSRSRAQSVISVSDSSRPNSSASTRLEHAPAHASPQSQVQNAQTQISSGTSSNQQQVRNGQQAVAPPPQAPFQAQSGHNTVMQHYYLQLRQQREEQDRARLLALQQQQQQFQQQQAVQQPPPQARPQPSTPLVPVPPSPGTQPPPPSGSTDGSFLGEQIRDSPKVEDSGGMVAGMVQSGGSTPVPMTGGEMGTSISTALRAKRGSVVLEGLEDEEGRKKMRMSEEGGESETRESSAMEVDTKLDSDTGGGGLPSSTPTTAMSSDIQSEVESGGDGDEEEDEDDEEEEEDNIVGPDGLRTVESCLESFFAREGDTRTCRMCMGRHAKGLIPAPVSFTNAGDQALVGHCLAEHDVVWNQARQDV